MPTSLEVDTALRDSAFFELVFQQTVEGNVDDNDSADNGDGDNEMQEEEDHANEDRTVGWVDNLILNTRGKGSRQTSALKLYKVRDMG
jgi:hypothetical protein